MGGVALVPFWGGMEMVWKRWDEVWRFGDEVGLEYGRVGRVM